MRPRTVLWASLLPDLPLVILTAWYFITQEVGFGPRYDDLFYYDPLWVIAHNLFHAPLVTIAIGCVGVLLWRRARSATSRASGAFLLSFSFGTTLHTLVDIVTHHDDGPLLLFPFNWQLRYASPVSYWDPAHYGRIVAPIDLALTLLFTAYLVLRWWRRRRARSVQAAGG